MADIYGCSARILVNGRKVREYECEDGALFVESKHGSEYEILLQNHMGRKVLAVVSVDGLDVISGKPASNKSPGYILKPQSSMRVRGFRKDDETIGAFRFVNKKKSYAKGQGQGGNEGVISVRFFDEKQKQILFGNQTIITNSDSPNDVWFDPNNSAVNPNLYMSHTTCDNSDINEGSSAGYSCNASIKPCGVENEKNISGAFQTGTTWGTKKYDKVSQRDFERGNLRGEINFYYTTKDGLKSLGVPVVDEKHVSYPKGFSDYATPPKGWA